MPTVAAEYVPTIEEVRFAYRMLDVAEAVVVAGRVTERLGRFGNCAVSLGRLTLAAIEYSDPDTEEAWHELQLEVLDRRPGRTFVIKVAPGRDHDILLRALLARVA